MNHEFEFRDATTKTKSHISVLANANVEHIVLILESVSDDHATTASYAIPNYVTKKLAQTLLTVS